MKILIKMFVIYYVKYRYDQSPFCYCETNEENFKVHREK